MAQQVININDDFCKFLKNAMYYTLFFSFVLSQTVLMPSPIFAKNSFQRVDAIENEISAPIVNLEQEKIAWENSIQERYKAGKISDVTTGVKHIKFTQYIGSRPVKLNVIEINKKINPDIDLTPIAAGQKLASKRNVYSFAKNSNILAAVNGTYFAPPTGIPLGTLMIDGKLYTGPIYNRVALCISDNSYEMARVELNAKILAQEGAEFRELKVNNVNQPRMLSTYVLVYTPEWGENSPPTPKYGIQIAVSNNKITQISNGSLPIPKDGYVISGPKEKLEPFFNVQNLSMELKTFPGRNNIKHIISGGPYLVRNGSIFIDTEAQKLQSVTGRNPRTAIGITAEQNLVMVTVDGREESSIGMTLSELANFMKSIGCVDAMNLDGGGSSVMYLNGNIVNNPSIKGGIALSNILAITQNEANQLASK